MWGYLVGIPMDLEDLLGLVGKKDLNLDVIVEGEKILEVRSKERNIELEIFNFIKIKELLKELRK